MNFNQYYLKCLAKRIKVKELTFNDLTESEYQVFMQAELLPHYFIEQAI